MLRYSFYRGVHRYLRYMLNTTSTLIARTDFKQESAVTAIIENLAALLQNLRIHAKKEEELFHPLFEKKSLDTHAETHEEHEAMENTLTGISKLIEKIQAEEDLVTRTRLGDELHDMFNAFHGTYLGHLNNEEQNLMPTLHKVYTDEELRNVLRKDYEKMPTPVAVYMCTGFFPHIDPISRLVYLEDFLAAKPDEFSQIWEAVSKNADILPAREKEDFQKKHLNSASPVESGLFGNSSHKDGAAAEAAAEAAAAAGDGNAAGGATPLKK